MLWAVDAVKEPCYSQIGFGYWTAKRRLNIYTTTAAGCFQSPFVWDTNSTTSGLLPAQSWESSLWYPGEPSCFPVANSFESCVHMYPSYQYKLNDMVCLWPTCPLCQLDAA